MTPLQVAIAFGNFKENYNQYSTFPVCTNRNKIKTELYFYFPDQEKVAEILIRAASKVNSKADGDWTALHFAAQNSKFFRIHFKNTNNDLINDWLSINRHRKYH